MRDNQWLRRQWHPHRELLSAVSPNAISPYDWSQDEPFGRYIYVPIDHWHPASFYIEMYRLLAGYQHEKN